jgi:biotin carboxyl carrier protein
MSVLAVTIDGYTYEIDLGSIPPGATAFNVEVNGESVDVILPDPEATPDGRARFIVAGRPYEVSLDRELRWIHSQDGVHQLEIQDLDLSQRRPAPGDGRVKAPIPGLVTRVMVSPGDEVQAGQPLLILEAMKMENEIRAPRDGEIERLNVRPGQQVALQQVLVEVV